MLWFEGPVPPNDGVKEVAHFREHGAHECGAQLGGVGPHAHTLACLDEF